MIKHRAQDKNERGLSVMEKLKLDFYYGREAEQFTFYRLPKALITDACFKGMTNNAKLLYGLMLDRMSLSKKRGWLDEANKVFIKYSLNNIEEDLNVSRKTASSLLKELEEIGLIDMIQQPGVANIIYVKNFVSERDQEVRNQREPESKCKRETGVKSKPVEKVHQCKNSTGEKTTPVEKSNQCSFEPGTSGKITLVPGGKLHPSNIEIDNNINNNNSINQSYQSIDNAFNSNDKKETPIQQLSVEYSFGSCKEIEACQLVTVIAEFAAIYGNKNKNIDKSYVVSVLLAEG